jgi:hypothetical protein
MEEVGKIRPDIIFPWVARKNGSLEKTGRWKKRLAETNVPPKKPPRSRE